MIEQVSRRFDPHAADFAGALDAKSDCDLSFELGIAARIINTAQDIALPRTKHRVEVFLLQLTIGQVRVFHVDDFGGV